MPSIWRQLNDWAARVCENKPRDLLRTSDVTDVISTDASAWGWGCFHLNLETGRIGVYHGSWSAQFEERGISTISETRAVLMALIRCFRPDDKRVVLLLTDDLVTALALNRGMAKSFSVNYYISRIHERFPNIRFVARHIEGVGNKTDGISRGEQVSSVDRVAIDEWLRRMLGQKMNEGDQE